MVLKIAYELDPEEIEETIKNIRTTDNNLVQRVLKEETTYSKECKELIKCDEEEFYKKRDNLVEALNLYKFRAISEKEKRCIDYKLFHLELKEIKKKKRWKKLMVTGGIIGVTGFCGLAGVGLVLESAIVYFSSCLGGLPGSVALAVIGSDKNIRNSKYLTLQAYAKVLEKSKLADGFMHDMPLLKNIYPVEYEDSDIEQLYKNNTEEFIENFSHLKNNKEKKRIIRIIYKSEKNNEEIISWLDTNESKLVREVGLDL